MGRGAGVQAVGSRRLHGRGGGARRGRDRAAAGRRASGARRETAGTGRGALPAREGRCPRIGAAVAGAYFGAKSRSDLNDAESAYRANGNAYTPAGLDKLRSGNSAGHTANALFIASGILVAAGVALTFAF